MFMMVSSRHFPGYVPVGQSDKIAVLLVSTNHPSSQPLVAKQPLCGVHPFWTMTNPSFGQTYIVETYYKPI